MGPQDFRVFWEAIEILKANLGFISGRFKTLHVGHIRLFRSAKEYVQKLIVVLEITTDNPSEEQRRTLEEINKCAFVDVAFASNDIEKVLLAERPDILFKGLEHAGAVNYESYVISDWGGEILFGSGEGFFSQGSEPKCSLVDQVNIPLVKETAELLSIDLLRLVNQFSGVKNLNPIVLGDIIVDSYIDCDAIGMSGEEPALVVKPKDEQKFLGGAGVVACHAKAICGSCQFTSIIGDDSFGRFAESILRSNGVEFFSTRRLHSKTTVKTRYRANYRSLLRVNDFSSAIVPDTTYDSILENLEKTIRDGKKTFVIMSDFSYGFFTNDFCEQLVKFLERHEISSIADSQTSSQSGDLGRFKGVDFVSMTETEGRACIGDFKCGLTQLCRNIREALGCKEVYLKLREEGLVVFDSYYDDITCVIPPFCKGLPVDVSGAGDSMLTPIVAGRALGMKPIEVAFIASIFAAIQISNVGNTPITLDRVIAVIKLSCRPTIQSA